MSEFMTIEELRVIVEGNKKADGVKQNVVIYLDTNLDRAFTKGYLHENVTDAKFMNFARFSRLLTSLVGDESICSVRKKALGRGKGSQPTFYYSKKVDVTVKDVQSSERLEG
jgi:hypothetical protein